MSLVEDILNYFDNNLSPDNPQTLTSDNLISRRKELDALKHLLLEIQSDLEETTFRERVETELLQNTIHNLQAENKTLKEELKRFKRAHYQSRKLVTKAKNIVMNQQKKGKPQYIRKKKTSLKVKQKNHGTEHPPVKSRSGRRETRVEVRQENKVPNKFAEFFNGK